jgi:hypothetical protein
MSNKVAIPLMLVSLGIFAATHSIGCSSGSSGGGTGGAATGGHADAGSGTGGKGGTGGTGGSAVGGHGGGDGGTGGGGISGTDAGLDTRLDATDAPVDAPIDSPGDAPRDTTAATDVAPDAPRDTATDTATGTDAPRDVATDTGPADTGARDTGTTGLERAATLCPGFPADTTASMLPADFCTIYLSLCTSGRDATRPDMTSCIASYTASRGTVITTNGTVGACESYHICNAWNLGSPTVSTEATHCPHAEGLALCL